MSTQAPNTPESVEDVIASMSEDELRAMLKTAIGENAALKAKLPVEAAFVPSVSVIMRPAGFSRRGDGTFATQQPKLEVAVTRKSGKDAVVFETPAVWLAILDAAESIRAALA